MKGIRSHLAARIWRFTVVFGMLVSAISETRGPMQGINSDSKFIVYYGDDFYSFASDLSADPQTWELNDAVMNSLAQFDVVVISPNRAHCTPEVVQYLKDKGVAYVLGYISIGEDFINTEFEQPIEFGSGMVELDTVTNTLIPSVGNTFQSFYLDVDSQKITYDSRGGIVAVETIERLKPDGKPDVNPTFHGYMINPDTNWRWVINNLRIGGGGVTGRFVKAGLKQLSGERDLAKLRDRSTDYGCDGFFLDTIDTAGPYDALGWYPWVMKEMQSTVKFISDEYPNKIVYANRGAFYFTAGLRSPITGEYPIDFSIRPYINAFLFESFRYDSDPSTDVSGGVSPYYITNRYSILPKVIAEASRKDGFTIFSLEYESGRPDVLSDAFSIGIREIGFVTQLCHDGSLETTTNLFLDLLPDSQNDMEGPSWDTTGNVLFNTPSTSFRVGTQEVLQGATSTEAIVRWDVAIDQSYPITYDIVVTDLTNFMKIRYDNVDFELNPNWNRDPFNNAANQYRITNFVPDHEYNIKVIAKDAKGNENNTDPGLNYFNPAIEMKNPPDPSLVSMPPTTPPQVRPTETTVASMSPMTSPQVRPTEINVVSMPPMTSPLVRPTEINVVSMPPMTSPQVRPTEINVVSMPPMISSQARPTVCHYVYLFYIFEYCVRLSIMHTV